MISAPKPCKVCHRYVVWVPSPGGDVPCNSFSVQVIADKTPKARMYFLGDGKVLWGRKAQPGEPGAVTAYESHYVICPESRRRAGHSPKKKTKAEIAEAHRAAEARVESIKALLLAQREKEWAVGGF